MGAAPEGERRAWPIRAYLVACVALVAVLIGGVGALLRSETLDDAEADAASGARHQAKVAAAGLNDSLKEVQAQLGALTAQLPVAQLAAQPALCTLSYSDQKPFRGGHLDLMTPDGRVFCSSLGADLPAAASHARSGWLAPVSAARSAVVTDPFLDTLTGTRSVTVASAVRGPRGEVTGVVAAVLHLPGVTAELSTVYGGPLRRGFTLQDGEVVLDSTDAQATAEEPFRGDRIVGSANLAEQGWVVHAGVERELALQPVRTALNNQRLLEAGALALLLLMLLVLNRRVARPLRRLNAAVAQAARHVPPAPLPLEGPSELRALTESFDKLVEARQHHEEQLSRQALQHPLTGLPNRVLLLDRLTLAAERAQESGRPVVLYCLDLDRFQLVNHTHGHDMGDRVLLLIAQRLKERLLPGDTLAHLAADEFFVLTSQLRDGETAVGLGRELAEAVALPLAVDGVSITQTASVGVALLRDGTVPEDLIRDADTAMARAKERGSGVEVFDENLRWLATERLQREADLRAAVEHGDLRVEYQPTADVLSGRIIGVEALLRWDHSERGAVPPTEFVRTAEETGLITEIGDFVLQTACTQGAAWVRAGYDLRVAVNVSGRQLVDPAFPEKVASTLERTGFPPRNLCLELTESTLVEGAAANIDALDQLRDLGLHLSIDDFGTGYSSLSYLKQFPVNELKIDQSFVQELTALDADQSLVRAMVAMAKALGLRVVAEGVEDEQQLTVLAELGCDVVQGFLLARPQRAYSVTTLLASRDQTLSAAWAAEHPGAVRAAATTPLP